MSLADAIAKAFVIAEPALEREAVKLLELVFSSPSPRDALERAQRVLTTDAANAAADALLDKILPPDDSPPAGS